MLTPPLEDDSPEPSRATGFRIPVTLRNEVGQLLHEIAGPHMGEVRAFSFSTGTIPINTKLSQVPNKLSMQVWSERQAQDMELVLSAKHVFFKHVLTTSKSKVHLNSCIITLVHLLANQLSHLGGTEGLGTKSTHHFFWISGLCRFILVWMAVIHSQNRWTQTWRTFHMLVYS